MTKFINGTSDCVAGCVVSSHDFITRLNDINRGPSMLLGPVLDSIRAASILKNLHSLHIRMARHSENALYLAGEVPRLRPRCPLPRPPHPSAARAHVPADEPRLRLRRHRRGGRRAPRRKRTADEADAGGEGRLPRGEPRLLQDAVQPSRATAPRPRSRPRNVTRWAWATASSASRSASTTTSSGRGARSKDSFAKSESEPAGQASRASGTRAITRKPPLTAADHSASPPSSRARSRIPVRPLPGEVVSPEAPLSIPSSSTSSPTARRVSRSSVAPACRAAFVTIS